MKLLLAFGVALFCFSQVSGEDILKAFWDNQVNAVTPDPRCSVDGIVTNSSALVKSTVDIIANSFSTIYNVMYPQNAAGCDGGFACTLQKITDMKDTVQSVTTQVASYKDNVSQLTSGISYYFSGKCPKSS